MGFESRLSSLYCQIAIRCWYIRASFTAWSQSKFQFCQMAKLTCHSGSFVAVFESILWHLNWTRPDVNAASAIFGTKPLIHQFNVDVDTLASVFPHWLSSSTVSLRPKPLSFSGNGTQCGKTNRPPFSITSLLTEHCSSLPFHCTVNSAANVCFYFRLQCWPRHPEWTI